MAMLTIAPTLLLTLAFGVLAVGLSGCGKAKPKTRNTLRPHMTDGELRDAVEVGFESFEREDPTVLEDLCKGILEIDAAIESENPTLGVHGLGVMALSIEAIMEERESRDGDDLSEAQAEVLEKFVLEKCKQRFPNSNLRGSNVRVSRR